MDLCGNMAKKDISEYNRKYHLFRHHAWAGLGFLSVALAVRLVFPESSQILVPIIFVLTIYIVIALLLTYKYHSGLSINWRIPQVHSSDEVEKEKIKSKLEKERLKIEKKKAKADLKKAKKLKK